MYAQSRVIFYAYAIHFPERRCRMDHRTPAIDRLRESTRQAANKKGGREKRWSNERNDEHGYVNDDEERPSVVQRRAEIPRSEQSDASRVGKFIYRGEFF